MRHGQIITSHNVAYFLTFCRFWGCLVALTSCMLALITREGRSFPPAQAPSKIVASELSIVDDQGKVRVSLGTDAAGPFLVLYGRAGDPRLEMQIDDDGDDAVAAKLYRADKAIGLSLSLMKSGESLIEFFGDHDRNILRLAGKPNGSSAVLLSNDTDDENASFVGLKMDPNGRSGLSFYPQDKRNPKIHMELSKDGAARVFMSDLKDKPVFEVDERPAAAGAQKEPDKP